MTTFSPMSSTRSVPDFQHLEPHSEYYLPGGDLHILVGNIRFRVHSYFFQRESSTFQDILATPATPGQPRQGTSDSNALLLGTVQPEAFAKFLWVFYNRTYSIYDAPFDDWACILDQAHQWKFEEVKSLAIRELEKVQNIPVVDRIILYQKYAVGDTYLIPLFVALCARDDPPTMEESQKMDLSTIIKVFHARERLRSRPSCGGKSPLPDEVDAVAVRNTVQTIFGTEEAEPEPTVSWGSMGQAPGSTPSAGAARNDAASSAGVARNGAPPSAGPASSSGAPASKTSAPAGASGNGPTLLTAPGAQTASSTGAANTGSASSTSAPANKPASSASGSSFTLNVNGRTGRGGKTW